MSLRLVSPQRAEDEAEPLAFRDSCAAMATADTTHGSQSVDAALNATNDLSAANGAGQRATDDDDAEPDADADATDSDYDSDSWITASDRAVLKALGAAEAGASPNSRPPGQRHRLRRIPRGTVPVKLVGEGAANAVFEIKLPPRHRNSREYSGYLLRVAKVPALGRPLTYDYLWQQQFYQQVIKPLLEPYTVPQDLVVLHKSGIVNELNKFLKGMDHLRRKKFRGTFVGQSDWGFLVEDMRLRDLHDHVLIEFKPKWLSQSPSAPKSATRCRQCAAELRNLVKNPSPGMLLPEKKFCPLALGHADAPWQASLPFRIAPQLAGIEQDSYLIEAFQSIADHPAMRELQVQQASHDTLGPLGAQLTDPRFIVAMTLRDCTCFAQIDRRRHSIRLRLGDFDWKNPDVKFDRWRDAEAELVNGGFYTARRILCGGACYRPPTLCALVLPAQDGGGSARSILRLEPKGSKNGDHPHSNGFCARSESVVTHETDVTTLREILEPFKEEHLVEESPSQ